MPHHPTPARPARARLAVAVAAALALVLAVAGPVFAHTVLRSSNPAAGSTVRTPPPQLELVFSEDIDPAFVQIAVEDSTGARPVAGVVGRGPSVTAPFPTGLRNGRVLVRYRVVSADGHPIAGEVAFTLAAENATQATVPGQSPSSPQQAATTTSRSIPPARASDISNVMMTALMVLATLVLIVVGVLLVRSDRRHRRP